MDILIAVAIVAVIGAIAAVGLVLADKFMSVPTDERAAHIEKLLPGANCGACGYSGCDGYAKALCDGKTTETNLCIPGGAEASEGIAEILGLEAKKVEKKVAFVRCNGTCGATKRDEKQPAKGASTCREAVLVWGGDNVCLAGCIGLGDCVAACPQKAIVIKDGIAKVISSRCYGCGLCMSICPHGVIRIMPKDNRVAVACSNHDKGAITRKMCVNGCIGCSKCVKTCPSGAISMVENLALIDYDKCTGCGACADACPIHVIHKDSFICDNCLK